MSPLRRRSLELLADRHGGRAALASRLGVTDGHVAQMITGHLPLTDRSARKFEAVLELPDGWMDLDHDAIRAEVDPGDIERLVLALLRMPPELRAYWIRTITEFPVCSGG